MYKKQNYKLTLFLLLVIILLLILIVFLLFKGSETNVLKPSGNIDIFDINCNYNCDCDSTPVFGEDDFKDNFDVTGNGISWKSTSELKIFQKSMYVKDGKIAPESSNFYQFIVKNNTIYNIKYDISFDEINVHGINMKFRLIKNNEYVVGDSDNWVTYDNLKLESIFLNKNIFDTYYLEWKWFSSENDTKIGESSNANYSLNISIKAVEV